ncbi:Disease resistance protein RPS5 [Rhynchospora pubera]|uniref:Disease resistance protein RPS5 n=1 Tax=Rhynchospora pubera TaxID=906938 RepID=A0AAV8DSK9_9POAL|nr:Disease resistance protein RPS5 [Rhynchospora pubera]
MDLISKIIDSAISSFIGPISDHITYPFKVSDNVKALDLAISELAALQADVKNGVKNAKLLGLMQNNQVEQWLGRVEAVRREVDNIRNRYQQRSRCLGGWSFNCWSNYWISKNAMRKLREVEKLHQKGNFEKVDTQLPPQIQDLPVGLDVGSKEEAGLQEILRYIDDNQYNTIGIWGMGGVGKTRLLLRVHNHCNSSSAFDVVIFVTASRNCSVEKIQADLCQNYSFGRGTNVESQATIIRNYLSDCNFIILLDDLWEQIDLQKVGIPFPLGLVNQFKRKVVLSTRLLTVCGLMDVQKSHKVVGLDTNDALRLFYEKVGDETINSHPQIRSLATKVVKELDGLPLALITIGRSMHGKMDPKEWDHAIDLLQKSRLNEIETVPNEEKIFHLLKYSYDSLESGVLKDCFLACSLWPEDWPINKDDLIECWIGLGLLDAFDAENYYNPGYTLIGKLLSSCLLEQGASTYRVKMHDIIRDMALWLAHDSYVVRDRWIVGADQALHEKDRWHQTERAALFVRSQDCVDRFIPGYANKLQFLMVRHSIYGTKVRTIIKNLGLFCTLTFLNLSRCNLIAFPEDVSKLVNLSHLNLSFNKISSVPEELKFVKNLKYLILRQNCIGLFPKSVISELKELMILDLFVNRINFEHLSWLIKEMECLGNIRSIGITLQHAIHFWSLLELPNLPIRFLELDYVDGSDVLVIAANFVGNSKIQDNLYRLELKGKSVSKIEVKGESQSQLKYLEYLEIEGMELLEEIIWRNIAPKDLFVRLDDLVINNCGKLKDISWVLELPCLQKLKLLGCRNMIQLIEQFDLASATEDTAETLTPTFPSLTHLSLQTLPQLQIICNHQSIRFPSLEKMEIRHCPKLRMLPFQSNTIPSNLETIFIRNECWENLEWGDNELKEALQPIVQFSTY